MDAKLSTDAVEQGASSLLALKACFPKKLRLRKRFEFQKFSHDSKRFLGTFLVIDYRKNGLTHSRLGITVTRRYGNACERNRFKRLVRETFRILYPKLPPGIDLNIKPRSAAKASIYSSFEKELLDFIKFL